MYDKAVLETALPFSPWNSFPKDFPIRNSKHTSIGINKGEEGESELISEKNRV